MKTSCITILILYLFCFLPAASAEDDLATKSSLIGADPAGNATGEITRFEGKKGLVCPSGFKPGEYPPNPYKDEKPLFRIDHTNLEKYKERLSPGQVARLKKHEAYYMNVYPTHRNMEFCDEFYAATAESRKSSRIDQHNILQDFKGGVAFPVPKNGVEAIWNVKRPYAGDDAIVLDCRRVVSSSGKVKKSLRMTKVIQYGPQRIKSKLEDPQKEIAYKIWSQYTYPADEAGVSYLTVGYLDDDRLEDAWIYLPSLRRVRRAPSLTGGGELDGESTMDELGFEFRGPVNDWDWKLLGRREMYIPVNNYDLFEEGTADEQECSALDINPAKARYELRRVWVVEGTVKPKINHPYSKRVGYYDEDTWTPAAADRYDKRGNLWRMLEFYTSYDYCQKMKLVPAILYMNLESGRYEFQGGCRSDGAKTQLYDIGLKEDEFTVQALRKSGR